MLVYNGSVATKDGWIANITQPSLPPAPAANTLRIRFEDTAFNPSTAVASNANKQGTWTRVQNSSYNDWDWTYNSTDWSGGFCTTSTNSGTQDRLFGTRIYDVIGAGDNSSVTNASALFRYSWGLRNVCDLNFSQSHAVSIERIVEHCPRIQSYDFIRNIIPASTNSYYCAFNNSTWNDYRSNSSPAKPKLVSLTDAAWTFGTTVNNFYRAFRNSRVTGSCNDVFSKPIAVASGTVATEMFFDCTQITELLSTNWPAGITGSQGNMFRCCFNATNATASYNAAVAKGVTASNMFYGMCGINTSAGRTALKALPTTWGGGNTQYILYEAPVTTFLDLTGNTTNGYYCLRVNIPKALDIANFLYYGTSPYALTSTAFAIKRSEFFGIPGSANAGKTGSSSGVSNQAFKLKLAMVQFEYGYNYSSRDAINHVNWWTTTGTIYSFSAGNGSISHSSIDFFRGKKFVEKSGTLDETRPVYLFCYANAANDSWSDLTKWYIYRGKSTASNTVSWATPTVSIRLDDNTTYATN